MARVATKVRVLKRVMWTHALALTLVMELNANRMAFLLAVTIYFLKKSKVSTIRFRLLQRLAVETVRVWMIKWQAMFVQKLWSLVVLVLSIAVRFSIILLLKITHFFSIGSCCEPPSCNDFTVATSCSAGTFFPGAGSRCVSDGGCGKNQIIIVNYFVLSFSQLINRCMLSWRHLFDWIPKRSQWKIAAVMCRAHLIIVWRIGNWLHWHLW